ncbi:PTS sugar transporter subunit IIA [Staphylococcus succinus]|jgi:PTS system galactitol-specific IIA component|uniref:PTS sugar transporter subunit IIA n=1 Tax=Staphylococcus succinus TaxID=61015 RepID=A0ABX5IM97_9STAP|nr:PTS sugar transporter subunit IIA [Staphylococcus succinus]MEB8127595.1 PTS sugar transporter subunit IIA [Staphylococcus succinus]MEB8210423.1 PTS sugar transporter subunit IIA [Staphylococcus succinus]PTI67772.1 PTS sugar transporter subunit IIA [Staphylococcus succinus]PTJ14550.1 PTS sugar transporter subunit IIA [Staphylococcus succinus]RIN25695.1 PTS sugar transporter subunit IIA [Staphylococcus succinus]
MQGLKIDASNIILNLEARTSDAALSELAELMYSNGYVKASYKDAVIAREKSFATGLPTVYCSVAIPHTDIEHVEAKSIGVAVLKDTVPFVIMGEAKETTDVKLIFMLAMDKEDAQLSLLQKLMGIFQNDQLLKTIVNAKARNEIAQVIEQELAET